MARNFYKKDGSYYYSDNNQKILDLPELQEAAKSGVEVPMPQTTDRNFYQKDGSYYYSDNNQKILDLPELQEAAKTGVEIPYEETQSSVDQTYADAVAENPVIADLIKGGSTVEEIMNAFTTGDWTGIVDWNGQPFSPEIQQEMLSKAQEDNKLYYEALQEKETADAEASLAQDQADYQDYLINSGQAFEADKTKSDQQAANQGVLFSGSRVQKEKNLARAYEQDQSYTRDKMSRNIGSTANDFQYKYGADAAKGLNQYYNLGGNTFNPNVARGGVGSSGLSSVYNPGNYSYQGTRKTERSANAQTRAAGYLWNRGNKLLGSGYNNQYN